MDFLGLPTQSSLSGKGRGLIRRSNPKAHFKYNNKAFQKGHRLVKKVVNSLSSSGYNVEYATPFTNDVDIKAWKPDRNWNFDTPDIVIECCNWKRTLSMSMERAQRIINNLNDYPTSRKILIVSYRSIIEYVEPLFTSNRYKIEIRARRREY